MIHAPTVFPIKMPILVSSYVSETMVNNLDIFFI